MVVLIVLLAAAAIGVIARIATDSGSSPELIIDDSVAADFTAVARADWHAFVTAFPALEDCIGQVTLVADYTLDDRAKYNPETQTMAVRVPGPRVLLDRAVIHELAHHLEFSCTSQTEMRPVFLSALGRSADEWFDGTEWGLIPSEIFAEAVVEYVLDERGSVHTDLGLIDQAAVDVVVDWARGH
jgi:hypothetical protein